MTFKTKLSEKIQRVLEENRELQRSTKPNLLFSRDTNWNGEPCAQCQKTNHPSQSKGKYIIHDGENDLFKVCGVCLPLIEQYFALSME